MKELVIKKTDHLEHSSGGTMIVSSKECPLVSEKIIESGNFLELGNGDIVPTCTCDCWDIDRRRTMNQCTYFDKVVFDSGRFSISCILLDSLNHDEEIKK